MGDWGLVTKTQTARYMYFLVGSLLWKAVCQIVSAHLKLTCQLLIGLSKVGGSRKSIVFGPAVFHHSPTPSPRPVTLLSLALSLPSATSTKWRPCVSTETASYAGYIYHKQEPPWQVLRTVFLHWFYSEVPPSSPPESSRCSLRTPPLYEGSRL